MLWYGQARRLAGFHQNHMASSLSIFEPACLLKSSYCPLAWDNGQRRHLCRGLDFPDFDYQWHSMSCPGLETAGDGFPDVLQGFVPGPALRDATGNGRAFGNEHPSLVCLKRHKELHTWILLHPGAVVAEELRR